MRLRSIAARVKQHIVPMHGAMSYLAYRKTKSAKPIATGKTELFGVPLWFSSAEGLFHSYKEIFQDGVYEFNTTAVEPLIIDAGANIGLSVIYFKKRFPECKIVAFEPDPEIFKLLKENVLIRDYRMIELREEAAWIKNEDLTFYSEGSLSGSTKVDFANAGNKKTIKASRFKDMLSQYEKIDFLKIDIEGAENDVLPDIESELHRVDRLFFEYHSTHDCQQHLGEQLSMVTRNGFRYVINGAHGSARPFIERYNNAYDLQLNISCFRS